MGSDNDYSDLTELEESDDYADPKSKKKGKASSSSTGGWKVKSTLKPPRATTYTTQALYDQIVSDDIKLDPEYQRDIVWPDSKQIMIIDSIYRNYYIPPIIFAVKYHEDGSETKTCIDGKQRLTSIHRFMEGLIPHKDPYTSEKLWYKDTGGYTGPKHRIIPEKYRKVFANKQIVCVEYHEISESSEREVFQRVQLGMALTPAEKLQVIHTPRSSFIRDILLAHMKDGSLGGDALEWDTARGADFRCLAFAIYCMEKFSPTLKPPGIPQVEKWLTVEDPFPAKLQTEVRETYRIFSEMAEDSKYNKAFKKPTKMSPIEFMIIGIFIYVHKDKASLAELSTGIGYMREDSGA
ncbi:hypothetical protein NLJ89_g10373 [Agrocybe chaxingu]|uniref:GmrSD restriction endonucleases N-terminal domain-containing protein n=1 Tax=Agrocybe chaxingu TaxID=84603 RepID=A0A9W8MQZ5_9AGAR|nr:hypothetical protein NLJ89_g10373 [Agrocybe chaxingu]